MKTRSEKKMNVQEKIKRFNRLEEMIKQGNVIRHGWTDGQERACLLAAISPEAGAAESARECPADLIPAWLSELTPDMDDNGTNEAWPGLVRRYSSVVREAALTLDDIGWRRAEYRARAGIVAEAKKHTANPKIKEVCDTVISLCQEVADGAEVDAEKFNAARDAAWEAARTARAARDAARAARDAAGDAARDAAGTARAAWEAARAAREAAWEAAWDRLNNTILDAIEFETKRILGKQ